ncbi:MAG: hypothetical protein NT062_37295 [Proteobacteria bacterium]|nr:hypothetical protein [Pseudomonadota bacterium]
MKLGTLLLRNAAIGLSQLESALRNQVLYGGRLGTNLVELGYIDLEVLASYLAEMSGHAVATPALLDAADPALVKRLPADDAHRLRAIPLGPTASDHAVAVAFVDPTDTAAIMAVADKLGANITPYVVPELRALYYLEKLYGLPRLARFIRSGRGDGDGTGLIPAAATSGPTTEENPDNPDERRRAQPAGGMVMPPPFTLQPRGRRPSQLPISTTLAPTTTYAAACEQIDRAQQRDHIGDAFVAYARGRCDALAVLIVRDGNALGWRAWLAPPTTPHLAIEELSLPLGGASSLQSAHDAGQVFAGEPPSTARPIERQLWAALGTLPEPTAVAVIPVLVKSRVVNLVYAHALVGPMPRAVVDELVELAQRAATAYLRLIRVARGV